MSVLTVNWPNEFSDLKFPFVSIYSIKPSTQYVLRKHGSDLRKNRPLDEIITIYTNVKDQLLYKLWLINVTQSIKGSPAICNGFSTTPQKNDSDANIDKETSKTNVQKKSVIKILFSEKKPPPEPLVIGSVKIPTVFQPHKSPKKRVNRVKGETRPCPVCSVDVPVKNINLHLDSCLAATDLASRRTKSNPGKQSPLLKLAYTMINDKKLKKYLKEYGLNPNGDRKSMIWRLNRYTVLYDAECDSEHQKPVSEILKQVEREEREEKTNPMFQPPKTQKVVIDKNTDPEVIEKHRKDYHKSSDQSEENSDSDDSTEEDSDLDDSTEEEGSDHGF